MPEESRAKKNKGLGDVVIAFDALKPKDKETEAAIMMLLLGN